MHGLRVKRVLVKFEQPNGEEFELEMEGEFNDKESSMQLTEVGHTPHYPALWEDPSMYEHVLLDLRVAKKGLHTENGVLYTIRKVRKTDGR